MARVDPSLDTTTPSDNTSTIVTAAAIVAALYYGSEILIPIALAILLSFALAPIVKGLHRVGLGRVLPVIVAVALAFVVMLALGGLVASQLRDLSSDLPRYESTIVKKIDAVKSVTNSGAMRTVEEAVAKLTQAVGRSPKPAAATTAGPNANAPGPHANTAAANQQPPIPVEVVQPAMGPFETVMLVVAPLLHPLSMAAIVLIFVIFILLQREDLRNRAIRLFGASDLQRATAAINDGAKRLSRYLLTQLLVNATAGIVVGTALWIIGVPSPILLGIVFGVARFIPYVGPVVGAALPLVLATAVDPGWSMVLWTLASLLVVELIIGQVVEPFAYGHNTGLSPVAIIIAATVWTVLWGPVGLFLSTPLTVCLVVLGRHVEKLSFLNVLLGDQPPLSPAETFYQRLLANDPVEAADQAQKCLSEMSAAHYYDEVGLPGLLMAQDDAAQGRLDAKRQERISASAMEVIDDLDHAASESAEGGKERWRFFGFGRKDEEKDVSVDDLVPERVPERLRQPGAVMCIGARGPLDDAAAAMLTQVFGSYGIGAQAESYARLSKADLPTLDVSKARMIYLSALDGSSPAFLRFILRRLRRHAPHAEIVVGAWWRREGYRPTDEEIDEAIRHEKVSTLLDAVRFCFAAQDAAVPAAIEPDGEEDEPVAAMQAAS